MKILLPLIVAAIGTPLFAQSVTTSATPPAATAPVAAATPSLVPDIHSKTILETLLGAGPVMLVLFALSVFFVMLVIVYLMTIRRGTVVSSGYMATADALLRKRDYLGLLAVSNRHGEAIARVVQKMLDF
ncbi:MAG: biopolymer transport protein ExbB, partial [Verrucomicrobiota bacterium]